MKAKKASLTVLAGTLLSGSYLWLQHTRSHTPADPTENSREIDIPIPATATAKEQALLTSPRIVDNPGLISQDAAKYMPPPPTSVAIPNRPGFYRAIVSHEFSTYLLFLTIGAAAEIGPDGQFAGESSLKAVQSEYDLSDEELAKVIEYARFAVQSDRDKQAKEQEEVCSKKATFRSVEQFGAALNGYTQNVEAHQETLGRGAEPRLGPGLYSKMTARIRAAPNREVTQYDFPAMFNARRSELATEIERFCTYTK